MTSQLSELSLGSELPEWRGRFSALIFHNIGKIMCFPYFVYRKKDKTFVVSNICKQTRATKFPQTIIFLLHGNFRFCYLIPSFKKYAYPSKK
jgi:hypothetical protein